MGIVWETALMTVKIHRQRFVQNVKGIIPVIARRTVRKIKQLFKVNHKFYFEQLPVDQIPS
jgi:hypothetical protein